MSRAELRAVALRVAALALLLLLALVAAITVRTLARIPDATIYLVRSEPRTFTLAPVVRRLGSAGGPEAFAAASVEALASGATDAEARGGLGSTVPEGTRVVRAAFDDGHLEVELSPEFDTGGGSASMVGRLHQVHWTLTRPTQVDSVSLWMDGAPLRTLGGEGVMVPPTWSRPDPEDLPRW